MEDPELTNLPACRRFRDGKLREMLDDLKRIKRLHKSQCDEDGWIGGCSACPLNSNKGNIYRCAEFIQAINNEIQILENYFNENNQ